MVPPPRRGIGAVFIAGIGAPIPHKSKKSCKTCNVFSETFIINNKVGLYMQTKKVWVRYWNCIEYYSKEDCQKGCGSPECGYEVEE